MKGESRMNNRVALVFPLPEHGQAAMAYRQAHIDRGETWIHGSGGLIEVDSYARWLAKITSAVTASQTGWVNCHTYFGFVHGRIIGSVQIRETLNDALLISGGHIGYGVLPSERRKGYGTQMLRLAMRRCRELGMDRVLITCDTGNAASAKTAMACGGVLENEVAHGGQLVQRYWIAVGP